LVVEIWGRLPLVTLRIPTDDPTLEAPEVANMPVTGSPAPVMRAELWGKPDLWIYPDPSNFFYGRTTFKS